MRTNREVPYEELTRDDNRDRMATFRGEAIPLLASLATEAKHFDLNTDPADLPNPLATFVDEWTRRSASEDGGFRRDFVTAVRAAEPLPPSLSITPGPNGNGQRTEEAPKKKRRSIL